MLGALLQEVRTMMRWPRRLDVLDNLRGGRRVCHQLRGRCPEGVVEDQRTFTGDMDV
jgi:hypothetical protein